MPWLAELVGRGAGVDESEQLFAAQPYGLRERE